jgi:hypothetical protein
MEGGKAESREVRSKNKWSGKFDEKHQENPLILRFDSCRAHQIPILETDLYFSRLSKPIKSNLGHLFILTESVFFVAPASRRRIRGLSTGRKIAGGTPAPQDRGGSFPSVASMLKCKSSMRDAY